MTTKTAKKKPIRKRPAQCDCVSKIDAQLEQYNTAIDISYCFPLMGPAMQVYINVATRKLDTVKRKGPKTVVAAFCPFCGKRWVP